MSRVDVSSILDSYEQRLKAAYDISEFEERTLYIDSIIKAFQNDKRLAHYAWNELNFVYPELKAVADLEEKMYDERFKADYESRVGEEKPTWVDLFVDKTENSKYLKVFYDTQGRESNPSYHNYPNKDRDLVFRAEAG